MLTKTYIIKAPKMNVVVAYIPKGCQVWVVPSSSQGPESELDIGKPLEVSFGVTFKEVVGFEETDYVPVKHDLKFGAKSIIINTFLDEYGRDFPIKPTNFRIILPAGCALNTVPQ